MTIRPIALAALALLVGCGTPQERCILRETRDLRVLDRLIGETQANLARGYALEEVTVYDDYWTTCFRPQPPNPDGTRNPPTAEPCLRDRVRTETRPKAINLAEERAKLDSMQAKRRDLARTADRSIAQCRAIHPE